MFLFFFFKEKPQVELYKIQNLFLVSFFSNLIALLTIINIYQSWCTYQRTKRTDSHDDQRNSNWNDCACHHNLHDHKCSRGVIDRVIVVGSCSWSWSIDSEGLLHSVWRKTGYKKVSTFYFLSIDWSVQFHINSVYF